MEKDEHAGGQTNGWRAYRNHKFTYDSDSHNYHSQQVFRSAVLNFTWQLNTYLRAEEGSQ